ncbi:MAG: hypothetical protein IPI49_15510 [Myxococcales bacterium]|nr:hypothetical protein [Myxococcales bacterium]
MRDLLPSLVASSLGDVQLEERPAPESELDLSAWIEDAVHDAEARTLTIVWAKRRAQRTLGVAAELPRSRGSPAARVQRPSPPW